MNKKELSHVPIALLIIALFIGSFVFYRFNSEAIWNNLKTTISKVSGNANNKNLGDSKFLPTAVNVDSLDNCNIDIKLNDSKLELIPGAPASTNPNVKRFTYKSKETKVIKDEPKVGSIDVSCVGFETTIKQLATTIDTANKTEPAKITQLFGMPFEELSKLDGKSLYRLFITKRAGEGECKEVEKTTNVASISTELESRIDSKYIDCNYPYKDNTGAVSRTIKYKYLFDKNSKFILQLGESDADLLGVDNQILLINKL
jgi:hypothetical protein